MYCTEMFTLVQDRQGNQDRLFPMVLMEFPVPVSVPSHCTNRPHIADKLGPAYNEQTDAKETVRSKWVLAF